MTEFRKKYQSLPVNFHLWSQDKIAELWWKLALEWALSIDSGFCSCGVPTDSWQEESVLAKIKDELEE